MNRRRSSGALTEADADALLSGRAVADHPDLREIIGLMRTASAVPAPTPDAALAAMLQNGLDPVPVTSARQASRWVRWSVRIAAVTAAALTATMGAAAANALPAPVQTAVADIVGALTPLQLPRSAGLPEDASNDRGGAAEQPAEPADSDGAQEPSAEPGEATSPTPATAPPVPRPPAVAPPQPPRTRTPTTDDVEEAETDADEPEGDERDTDAPDPEEADADEPDTENSHSDAPGAGDGDAGDHDEPDSQEPDLDGDAERDQDDADGGD